MTIFLRDITFEDLPVYRQLISPGQAYHKLNGPYFGLPTEADQNRKIMEIGQSLGQPDPDLTFKLICDENSERMLGEVSYYWKDERTNWLEIGIVIFNETDWGKGIGRRALPLWIDHQFKIRPELVRIGLTTWSGNHGMIALATSLGLFEEARYRKARTLNGEYFDSLSYGILKEEWVTRARTMLD